MAALRHESLKVMARLNEGVTVAAHRRDAVLERLQEHEGTHQTRTAASRVLESKFSTTLRQAMGSDIRLERASDDFLPRAISELLLRDSYRPSVKLYRVVLRVEVLGTGTANGEQEVRSSGGAPRIDFWGSYHDFGRVFRRFGLFLAWTPAGDSPKTGSTKVGEKCGRTGRNVQAKSCKCFRFRIFAVRLFVTAPTTEPCPPAEFFREFLLHQLFFYNLNLFQRLRGSAPLGRTINAL